MISKKERKTCQSCNPPKYWCLKMTEPFGVLPFYSDAFHGLTPAESCAPAEFLHLG